MSGNVDRPAVSRRAWHWIAGAVSAAALAAGCGSVSGSSPAAQHTAAPAAYRLPAMGAPGYPEAVYPAPVRPRRGGAGVITACPAAVGLVTPTRSARAAATAIIRNWETTSRAAALHSADRALWPQVATDWRHHWAPRRRGPAQPVLYSGPLPPARRNFGVPNPAGWIIESCGTRVAQASYLIVTGTQNEPALQGALVFIDRPAHLLLYFSY